MDREEFNFEETKSKIFGVAMVCAVAQLILIDIYMPCWIAYLCAKYKISINLAIFTAVIRMGMTFVFSMMRPFIDTLTYFRKLDDKSKKPELLIAYNYFSYTNLFTSVISNISQVLITVLILEWRGITVSYKSFIEWMLFDFVVALGYFLFRKRKLIKHGYRDK